MKRGKYIYEYEKPVKRKVRTYLGSKYSVNPSYQDKIYEVYAYELFREYQILYCTDGKKIHCNNCDTEILLG